MAKPTKPRKPRANKTTKAKTKPEAEATAAAAAPARPSAGSANADFKKPAKDAVVKLVKRLESQASEAKGITSSMGEQVAKAVENQHFDRTALGIVRKLYKMAKNKPEQFARTFAHMLAYCDDLELDKIADENMGLDLDGSAEAEADGDDEFVDSDSNGAETDAPDEQPQTGKSAPLSIVPKGDASEKVPSPQTEAAE